MKEKKGGFLRWPWNIVIYALLLIALRLFAIPVILILMRVQQKSNPYGVQEGYCLTRTRKRISWVLWGLLWLVLSGALFWVLSLGLRQDPLYWNRGDQTTLIACGVAGVLLLLLGLYMEYHGAKDTFFPEKSNLAESIRGQLPYPDEAPPVKELFAMVDSDLKEHGQWFDSMGIGREWVLGDLVNRIDRIRGIFVVDEIQRRHSGGHTTTARVLELVLIDNRRQIHSTTFKSPDELRAAADCLALKVPGAKRGANSQWADFLDVDDTQWEDFEQEFRRGKARRASAEVQREALGRGPQEMVLSAEGEITSRVTVSLVEDHLRRCLSGAERAFALTPTKPIEGNGMAFRAFHVSASEGTVWLGAETADGVTIATKGVEEREARRVLSAWLRREAPDVTGWEMQRMVDPSLRSPGPQTARHRRPDELSLLYASGAAEHHTTFTQEDVELAAEGLVDGTYQMAALARGYLWIRVEAGDKSDGRYTVRASRPDPDKLRFFTTKTTHRQAAAWFLAYSKGGFLPGGPGWKDYTKEVEKV
ncbi:MAG: hypothetical protein NC489_40425 [Ruminococcus flavefaciens]|nr:hypothetical protein [Ruminococcus flavefaciens]